MEDDPNILASKREIRKKIRAKTDNWFQPELVDIFLKLSKAESFWLSLEKIQNAGYAYSGIAHHSIQEIEFEDLKSIVLIFLILLMPKLLIAQNTLMA